MEEGNSNLTVEKFALVFSDRDPMAIDFTQNQNDVTFNLQEGATYKIELTLRVKNQIIQGIRYHHDISRKGISVEKCTQMVGSLGPKDDAQVFLLNEDIEAPKGMIQRGYYRVESKVVDDYKIVHKQFSWGFSVKKNWTC